jgi:hypothetical protein
MRWKVGNINYASGTAKIAGRDSELCARDNGTAVCNAGHSLAIVGRCISQSIGTLNSAGSTCISDYAALSNNFITLINETVGKEGTFKEVLINGPASSYNGLTKAGYITYDEWIAAKSLYTSSFFSTLVWASLEGVGYNMYLDYNYREGTFSFLQRQSGQILHQEDTTSDFFQLDVFGTVAVLQPIYYKYKVIKNEKVVTIGNPDGYFPEIKTVVSGTEDVCVGDNVPPSIENISPAASSVLNESNDNISFDVVDAIGGVNKSTVYITVSGNLTTQPEGTSIVTAGVPVAQASFGGTDARYSLLYNPSNSWDSNEVVTVTVTGTDNVPNDGGGSPFSCYTGDPNPFGYTWNFKVENHADLGVYINAVADPYPPYLDNVQPAMWSGDANATKDITFDLLDEHSGVDLSSIFVYINGVTVVQNGQSTIGTSATLTAISSGYRFHYTNNGFSYGSQVVVRVVASDLYTTSPNTFDYTYYYYVIGSGTLRIENFYPEVGITWEPELVDIRVDVIDEVYDVDEGDLYLSINGTLCSASISSIAGLRNLTATVSGITTLSGVVFNDTTVSGLYLSNVDVSGSTVSGGIITEGFGYSGTLSNFPDPFSSTSSGSIISSSIEYGNLNYAILDTSLVSGVNWDGKYTNSTITNVDAHDMSTTYTTVTGTVISGSVGRRLEYHPSNNFEYQGAINVLVHVTNLNSLSPVTAEHIYQLFYGYNVKVFDREFGNSSRINVYLGAYNTKEFKNRFDYGYYFTTVDKPHEDLTATIVGIAPWEDLGADITPQAPVHRYGETVQVEVYVEDNEGNMLGPYTFSYTIEEAPE